MLPRLTALALLSECTGRDIWSVAYCQTKRIPQDWIEELVDCFESGFRTDRQTIYHQDQVVGQFEGVRDVDLARKLSRCTRNRRRFCDQYSVQPRGTGAGPPGGGRRITVPIPANSPAAPADYSSHPVSRKTPAIRDRTELGNSPLGASFPSSLARAEAAAWISNSCLLKCRHVWQLMKCSRTAQRSTPGSFSSSDREINASDS